MFTPRSRIVSLTTLILLGCGAAISQQDTPQPRAERPLRLTIPAGKDARSQALAIRKNQILRIVFEGAPTVQCYVHRLADKTLLARSTAEDREVFQWPAAEAVEAYVLARNTGTEEARLRIEVADGGPGEARGLTADGAIIRVFFAADRSRTGNPDDPLGTDPAADGELVYGAARVSIPRDHRMGELEGPSIFKLEFSPDQNKHIVVVGRPLIGTQAAVFNQIRQDLKEGKEPTALVFVHGFATSFQDAARRTAQLTYDLGFTGIPVLYTWASKGSISPIAYNHDGRNAELTAVKFQQFLASLAQQAGLKSVHVIAHSMGTRVVSKSLAEISRSKPLVSVQQVALFAPDIDAALFRQMASAMKTGASRITLYASSKDLALSASQRFATYPRAGQGGDGIVVVPGIETIDATSVDTNALAFFHGYYGDSRTVIGDLFYTLRGLTPKDRQGLMAKDKQGQTYWAFRP